MPEKRPYVKPTLTILRGKEERKALFDFVSVLSGENEKLRSAIRSTPAHLFTIGRNGRIEHASEATHALFGGSIIGMRYDDLFPDRGAAASGYMSAIRVKMREALKSKTTTEWRGIVVRKDGEGTTDSSLRLNFVPKGKGMEVHAALTDMGDLLERNQVAMDLFGITEEINRPNDLQTVLKTLAERIGKEFGAKVLVATHDTGKGDGDDLVIVAQHGLTEEDLSRYGRIPIGEGVIGRVAETLTPEDVRDIRSYDGSIYPELDEKHMLRGSYAIPLLAYNGKKEPYFLGVMLVSKFAKKDENGRIIEPEPIREYQKKLLRYIGSSASLKIRSTRLGDQMRELAYTNPVTGMHNRRYFFEELNKHLGLGGRDENADELASQLAEGKLPKFGIVSMDLRHLNRANAAIGHDNANVLLEKIGAKLTSIYRDMGIKGALANPHGDEFLALFRSGDRDKMEQFGKRAQEEIEALIRKEYPQLVPLGVGFDYAHTAYGYGVGGKNSEGVTAGLRANPEAVDLGRAGLAFKRMRRMKMPLTNGRALDLLMAVPDRFLSRRKGERKAAEGWWPSEAVSELDEMYSSLMEKYGRHMYASTLSALPEAYLQKLAAEHNVKPGTNYGRRMLEIAAADAKKRFEEERQLKYQKLIEHYKLIRAKTAAA